MSYPKIEYYKIEGNGDILGSSVKINVILNINTPTSIQIKIEDPTKVNKVSSANMTKEADSVYSYVYQSDIDDQSGSYVATVKVISSGYTVLKELVFDLYDPYDEIEEF